MFFKIGVLKNLQILQENTCVGTSATLLKRDSYTRVFLWNLQKFLEQILLQNTSGGCFYKVKLVNQTFIHFLLCLPYYILNKS